MAKAKLSQEEIDRIFAERMAEYQKKYIEDHTPKITMAHGNTYISFKVMDDVTIKCMNKIEPLLDLMRIEYGFQYPFYKGDSFTVSFKGEDVERAAFIQKFIDNGYKLSWN